MEHNDFVMPVGPLTGLETVGPGGVASILLREETTVRRQQYEAPELLPPPVPGTRPRIWRLVTIKNWLEGLERGEVQVQQPAPAASVAHVDGDPPRRQRGRPRRTAPGGEGAA